MSFQPQNPFEFVEQMLMNAGQTVSQGFGRGIQAREQRAAAEGQAAAEAAAAETEARRVHGRAVQQYGIQLLPTLHQLAADIGDEDPELVAALGRVAAEVERGVMSDPVKAAELIGNARAQLQRRQRTTEVVDFPASFLGEGAMSDEMASMPVHSETVTTEEFSPQEIIAYSYARAGEIERLRALDSEERDRLLEMAMKEFESGLILARNTAGSNYEFGLALVNQARETLAGYQAVVRLQSPEQQAQYESQITALQILATLNPQQAYAMYEQSGLAGGPAADVSLALAEIAGVTQVLTDYQSRIRTRFDNLVERIQDNKGDINRDSAIQLLRDVESYLPGYYIDSIELNMVRDYLGLQAVLRTPREYIDKPEMMAMALTGFATRDESGIFMIDTARMAETNSALYEAYMDSPDVAREVLTRFYNERMVDDLAYAETLSEAAREVIQTGIGYDQLPSEAKVEVRRALGNERAGDVWTKNELQRRAQLAAQATEATQRIEVAEAAIRELELSYELPAQLAEWAREGDYIALIHYVQEDPSREGDAELQSLIAQAREVHLAKIDMVQVDKQTREAQLDEALRKAQLGEYLDPFERAALKATYLLDQRRAMRDLQALPLETTGDYARVLSAIAEVVPEEWWDSANLPRDVEIAVGELGLMPALKAISRASEYELGSDVRDDLRANIISTAESVPRNKELVLEALGTEMRNANFSEPMTEAFLSFLEGAWASLEREEQRAEQGLEYEGERVDISRGQLALGWANHWLRVQELADQGDDEGAKELIGLVDGLVDNERQAIQAEHDSLVSLGCADKASAVFAGPMLLLPDARIKAGEQEGLSCRVLTTPFTETVNEFKGIQQWHQDLVFAAAEDYGYAPPNIDTTFDPSGIDVLEPFALGDLARARDWATEYSDSQLSVKPVSELFRLAAGLGGAIGRERYGAHSEAEVRRLYERIFNLLESRVGSPEETLRLITSVMRNAAQ